MLQLAAERLPPVRIPISFQSNTREGARILGPDRLLAPSRPSVFAKTRETARPTGESICATYLALPNYRNNLVGWAGR